MSLLGSTTGAPLVEASVTDQKGSITQINNTRFIESPTVEEYVREHFENYPVMAEVAKCESRFRHFKKNGDVIRGLVNSSDVGVMQINEYYHSDTADRLGINLYTLEGNIDYATYLFEKEGTSPWLASSKCWGVENHIAKR
ncbi:MAG: hypothetical protein ISR98_01530 [Parcubacteria group bacterium]|nr:hypothetical protein [Parcubacteria group bacterium]